MAELTLSEYFLLRKNLESSTIYSTSLYDETLVFNSNGSFYYPDGSGWKVYYSSSPSNLTYKEINGFNLGTNNLPNSFSKCINITKIYRNLDLYSITQLKINNLSGDDLTTYISSLNEKNDLTITTKAIIRGKEGGSGIANAGLIPLVKTPKIFKTKIELLKLMTPLYLSITFTEDNKNNSFTNFIGFNTTATHFRFSKTNNRKVYIYFSQNSNHYSVISELTNINQLSEYTSDTYFGFDVRAINKFFSEYNEETGIHIQHNKSNPDSYTIFADEISEYEPVEAAS